jgi:RNA polymerase sigma-70 factor (ECF subfamily)
VRREQAFDVGYNEIATAVDKSPAAVRKIAHRARQHVDARRPRAVASKKTAQAALEAFQRAIETADLQALLDVLAPDAVLLSDGGGIKQAATHPVVGSARVGRFLLGGIAKTGASGVAITMEPVLVNGHRALLMCLDGEIDSTMSICVEDDRITGLYYVRNPDKLTRVTSPTPIVR